MHAWPSLLAMLTWMVELILVRAKILIVILLLYCFLHEILHLVL